MTLLALIVVPYLQTTTNLTNASMTNAILPVDIITADAPIAIGSDAELVAAGFPGSGTSGDPYRIENLNIVLAGGETGIYITGLTQSNSYVTIRNCTITGGSYGVNADSNIAQRVRVWNNTFSGNEVAIRQAHSASVEAMNNTIDNCDYGIRFYDCNNSFAYNNTITNCGHGIYVNYCIHMFIKFNDVSSCSNYGILEEYSDEIVMQYNVVSNCGRGIEAYSTIDPYVGYNNVSDCSSYGIFIRYSDYARVGGNNFHACGLGVWDTNVEDLLTLQITSNYIDDNPIYYAENVTDYNKWTGASQFILVNCSNVQISSQQWLSSSLYMAISLHFCTDIDIRYSYINDAFYGIVTNGGEDIKIYNNTLQNNNIGVAIQNTDGGFIRENAFSDGTYAIYFENGVNDFDIYQNNLQTFSNYGMLITSTTNTRIYHNNFFDCGGGSYGYDDGTNTWYNTTLQEGNFWENWGGSGTYAISGGAQVDMYPLSEPYEVIIVSEYTLLSWFAVIFLAIIPALVIYIKKR